MFSARVTHRLETLTLRVGVAAGNEFPSIEYADSLEVVQSHAVTFRSDLAIPFGLCPFSKAAQLGILLRTSSHPVAFL